MNIRKFAYSLAIAMLSYDLISTMIASKLYGRFGDLDPIANLLGQENPVFVYIVTLVLILGLSYFFSLTLSGIESQRIPGKIPVMFCDFIALYLLIFEAVAVPHNTMVLFGSYGIIQSSEMFLIQEIASALIAGFVVVVVDWKKLLGRSES